MKFNAMQTHFFIRYFKLILCLYLFNTNIFGSNYYVDKYALGSNDGTSWQNAWNSFSIIEWSKLKPGDVLFISGGKDSTVYNETLTVEISGDENNLVTIRNGLDPMHNGKVIIDLPDIGLKITKESYIRILNIQFKNVTSGVYIRGASTGDVNVIYLDSLKVLNSKKQGAIFINGWSSSGIDATVDSVFIRYCSLTTSYPTEEQTDIIYAQYCNNLFILNNNITVASQIQGSHTDGIQFVHNIKNITIANNTINNLTDSYVNSKANGIMGTNLIGTGFFYNNVVYCPNFRTSGNNVFLYVNGTTPDDAGSWYIYNNIFIGGGTIKLFSIEDKEAKIKNNIFYSIQPETGLVFLTTPLDDWSGLDYNLYGQNNGTKRGKIIYFEGNKSMSQMRILGAELHGIDRQDPLFKTPFNNLYLQNNSLALNNGINLGVPFNRDKNNTERPMGGNWDIGCYQNLH